MKLFGKEDKEPKGSKKKKQKKGKKGAQAVAPKRVNKTDLDAGVEQRTAAIPISKKVVTDDDIHDISSEVDFIDDGFDGFEGFGHTFDEGFGASKIKINKNDETEGGAAGDETKEKMIRKDPKSYNKKLEEKKKSKVLFFMKWSKKVKIAVGAGLGVILLLIIIGIAKGGKSGDGFYTTLAEVFSREKGTFKYVLDIGREYTDSDVDLTEDSLSKDDLNQVDAAETKDESSESSEDSEEAEPTEEPKYTNDTWETKEGVDSNVGFPNVTVTIEGCTLDNTAEELTTNVKVTMATKNINDVFTTITVKDGSIYYDTQQMRSWLMNSKDAFCVNLANSLPSDVVICKTSLNDFKVGSGWAENSEGGQLTNPVQWWRSIRSVLDTLINLLSSQGSMGITESEGVYNLALSGDTGVSAMNTIKSLVTDRASLFETFGGNQVSLAEYGQDQADQAYNQRDNFLAATDKFYRDIVMTDSSDAGLEVKGMAHEYQDEEEYDVVEGSLACYLRVNGVSYKISLSGQNVGKGMEINEPEGTTGEIEQGTINNIVGLMADYYNPTSIALYKRLNYADSATAVSGAGVDITNTTNLEDLNKLVSGVYDGIPSDTGLLGLYELQRDYINTCMGEEVVCTVGDLNRILMAALSNTDESQLSEFNKKLLNVIKTMPLSISQVVPMLMQKLGDLSKITEGIEESSDEGKEDTEKPEPTPEPVIQEVKLEGQTATTSEIGEFELVSEPTIYKSPKNDAITVVKVKNTANDKGLQALTQTININDFCLVTKLGDMFPACIKSDSEEYDVLNDEDKALVQDQVELTFEGNSAPQTFYTFFILSTSGTSGSEYKGADMYYQNRIKCGTVIKE